MPEETNKMRYFVTKRQLLQYLEPIEDAVISFGKYKRFATEDSSVLQFLAKRLSEQKGPKDFREVSKEEYDAQGPKKPNEATRQAQILASIATSRGGEFLDLGTHGDKPPLDVTSTQDSPITGGQNPANMQTSQADTIAALRGRLASGNKTT